MLYRQSFFCFFNKVGFFIHLSSVRFLLLFHLWLEDQGEILKQSADEEKINTQSANDEPLYAVGKDVSITMKEYEQVKSFYKLKGEDDGQAAKDAG